jgi:hypothetical protein
MPDRTMTLCLPSGSWSGREVVGLKVAMAKAKVLAWRTHAVDFSRRTFGCLALAR